MGISCACASTTVGVHVILDDGAITTGPDSDCFIVLIRPWSHYVSGLHTVALTMEIDRRWNTTINSLMMSRPVRPVRPVRHKATPNPYYAARNTPRHRPVALSCYALLKFAEYGLSRCFVCEIIFETIILSKWSSKLRLNWCLGLYSLSKPFNRSKMQKLACCTRSEKYSVYWRFLS